MELKGRAIEILKSFSKNELKEFIKFLESPFHNNNTRLIDFFNTLKNYYPEFNQTEFTGENIYTQIFGASKFSYQVLKNLMSELYKKECEFFILQNLNNDEAARNNYLLKELDVRGIENSFKYELEKIRKKNRTKGDFIDGNFIYNAELASREVNHMLFRYQQDKTGELKIKECENITAYFFSAFSYAYSTLIFNEFTYNIYESSELIDNLLASIDFEKFEFMLSQQKVNSHFVEHKLKYLKACHRRFKDIEVTSKEMFESLMKNIEGYAEVLKFDLITDVISLFTAEIAAGKFENIQNFIILMKYKDNNGLIVRPGQNFIEPGAFLNDLKVIMLGKDYEYSKKFIENCEKHFAESERNDLMNFGYALHFTNTNEFNKAIEFLAKISKVDFKEKYYVKGILLRCYYELGSYDALFSTIESYRAFLYRNKNIPAIHKDHNIVFLSFLEKLAKLKIKKEAGEKSDFKEIENIQYEIKSANRVNSRQYLLQKAEEILL